MLKLIFAPADCVNVETPCAQRIQRGVSSQRMVRRLWAHSNASGVKVCKKPCACAIAFARSTLASALNISVLLASRKPTRIAQAMLRDKLTSVRHPLCAGISSELHKRSIRHHVVRKFTPGMTWVMDECRLPMVISAQSHIINLLVRSTYGCRKQNGYPEHM